MKVFKIIFSVFVCLVILTAMIYTNYGGFSNVRFQIKKEGGETLVYREINGPYDKTGETINKINNDLESLFKIETLREFGLFFDDPQQTEKRNLRSQVGCILEEADTAHVVGLKSKFNIKICPVKEYITAEFPYKGRMSITIGLMKVYPALMKYVKTNGYSEEGPIMEIYDMPNNKIMYRKEAVKITL